MVLSGMMGAVRKKMRSARLGRGWFVWYGRGYVAYAATVYLVKQERHLV